MNAKKAGIGRKGFTLVELIVVLVILSILLAITVPSMTGWIKKARHTQAEVECRACVVAAQTLVSEKYAADTLSAWYGGTDLTSGGAAACRQDIFDLAGVSGKSIESVQYDSAAYSVTYLKYWYNAGEYVIYENGSFVFGEGSGGAATPTPTPAAVYPGTGLALASGVWPTEADYADDAYKSVSVSPSGIFLWTDGSYYVVNTAISLTRGQALSGPGGDANNWFSTQKLTGKVWHASDFAAASQRSDMKRGDLYYDETSGTGYVYIDGGTYANSPTSGQYPHQWYKLP